MPFNSPAASRLLRHRHPNNLTLLLLCCPSRLIRTHSPHPLSTANPTHSYHHSHRTYPPPPQIQLVPLVPPTSFQPKPPQSSPCERVLSRSVVTLSFHCCLLVTVFGNRPPAPHQLTSAHQSTALTRMDTGPQTPRHTRSFGLERTTSVGLDDVRTPW